MRVALTFATLLPNPCSVLFNASDKGIVRSASVAGSFQIFGAIRCPRYSLTIIWLKIKHFEKQIVLVDLAVNTPLKLVVSYCDNAPISSVGSISSKTKPDLEICDVPREVAGLSLRYIKTIFMFYSRAVANGPVGPAMAGPIIEPVI